MNTHDNVEKSLTERAKALGLDENSTEREIILRESSNKPGGPSTLASRAIVAGLDYNASEGEVSAAEARNKDQNKDQNKNLNRTQNRTQIVN